MRSRADVAIVANVLRKARHTTITSRLGNSGRLAPRTWPITHEKMPDKRFMISSCPPSFHLAIGEKGDAAGYYPCNVCSGGVVSTHGKTWCRIRGPLSGLNNPGLSTHFIDSATMMDVSSFVRDQRWAIEVLVYHGRGVCTCNFFSPSALNHSSNRLQHERNGEAAERLKLQQFKSCL